MYIWWTLSRSFMSPGLDNSTGNSTVTRPARASRRRPVQRAERREVNITEKQATPLPPELVERFLILCRIVRTGLRNRGISRYRDPPVVSYRTNQRLVYDRGVRDFCY